MSKKESGYDIIPFLWAIVAILAPILVVVMATFLLLFFPYTCPDHLTLSIFILAIVLISCCMMVCITVLAINHERNKRGNQFENSLDDKIMEKVLTPISHHVCRCQRKCRCECDYQDRGEVN